MCLAESFLIKLTLRSRFLKSCKIFEEKKSNCDWPHRFEQRFVNQKPTVEK